MKSAVSWTWPDVNVIDTVKYCLMQCNVMPVAKDRTGSEFGADRIFAIGNENSLWQSDKLYNIDR
jgi:hypothetical protein